VIAWIQGPQGYQTIASSSERGQQCSRLHMACRDGYIASILIYRIDDFGYGSTLVRLDGNGIDLNVLFAKVVLPAFVFVKPAGFSVHVYKVLGFSDTSKTRAIDEGPSLWKAVPIESRFLGLVTTLDGIIYLCWRLGIAIDDDLQLAIGTRFVCHTGLVWTPCRGCWHC